MSVLSLVEEARRRDYTVRGQVRAKGRRVVAVGKNQSVECLMVDPGSSHLLGMGVVAAAADEVDQRSTSPVVLAEAGRSSGRTYLVRLHIAVRHRISLCLTP